MDVTNGLPNGHNDMANTLKEMLKITSSSESTAQEKINHAGGGDAINNLSKDYSSPPPDAAMSSESQDQDDMSQTIVLENVDDGECVRLVGDNTQIISNINTETDNPTTASNKVTTNTITKFEWEHRYYAGSLISATNLYIAYSIKGRGSYNVRVINRHNSSDRILLKGFTGFITDVSFAHSTSNTLAAVDNMGNLIVWILEQVAGSIVYEKKLHVIGEEQVREEPPDHRVVWIPCVQTDQAGRQSDDENGSGFDLNKAETQESNTMVLFYKNVAEVWDLAIAYEVANAVNECKVERSQVAHSFVLINGHDDDIADCELSPIGNVLAAASYDGFVKFWQVQIEDTEPPTCLHQFKPHDGKPVSSVRFCDDKNQSELTVYWRFLLTGCDRNIELKLWCTVSWECLQIIRFQPSTPAHVVPEINLVLHRSADFLILSDINRKVLYVMEVKSDLEIGRSHIDSLSHYQLASPILSTALVDAKPCKFKTHVAAVERSLEQAGHGSAFESEEEDEENFNQHDDDTDKSEEKTEGTLIKMLTIQTRSLQSLDVRFIPHNGQLEGVTIEDTYNTTEDIQNRASVDSIAGRSSLSGSKDANDDTCLAGGDSIGSPPPTASSTFVGTDDKPIEEMLSEQVDESLLSRETPDMMEFGSDKPGSDEDRVAPDVTRSTSPPVLLTPDAFMGLHKSPGKASEAAGSSFTAVTPFSNMSGSFFQQNQDNLLADVSGNPLMLSPSTSGAADALLQDSASLKTPPSSPIVPKSSSSPPASGALKAPSAAAEILQAFCSRSSTKSPDLISSTSTLDDAKHEVPAPAPISTPPGLPGRTYKIGPSLVREGAEAADVLSSILVPVTSTSTASGGTSAWPKAPDVTMSRPITVRTSSSSSHQPPVNQSEVIAEALHVDALANQSQANIALPMRPLPDNEPLIDSIKDLQQQQENMLGEQQRKLEVIAKKQTQMQKQTENAFKRSDQQGEKLDKAVKGLAELQRKLSSDMKANQTAMTDAASSKIDRAIKSEMKRSILPSMTTSVEQVKDQLNTTVAQQLTATDNVLKESINKALRSKEMVDTIAAATAKSLQEQMKSSLPEIFFSTLIPAFERSCQAMFQQLSATYHRGMEETVKQLEKQMQFRIKGEHDKFQGIVKEANDTLAQLQSTSKQAHADLTKNIHQQFNDSFQKTLTGFEGRVTANVIQAVKQQQEKEAAEQRRVITDVVRDVISRTMDEKIPLPSSEVDLSSSPIVGAQPGSRPRPSVVDQQQKILKMLQQGNVNTAFQTALTASDLNLVMYVCETVDPAIVFGVSPCPLHQPILLSLIQQLSSDLATKTEIKLKYLQEAVMNLDRTHQITKEYMHSVLSALVQKLQTCAQGPLENQSLIKDLKMLAMAAQSLMK